MNLQLIFYIFQKKESLGLIWLIVLFNIKLNISTELLVLNFNILSYTL